MGETVIRVELGCGMKKPDGYIGIDIRPYKCVDYVLDLGKDRLPFDNDSVDEFRAQHLFEHFTSNGLFWCVEECWRCLKPSGELKIAVPKAGTPGWFLNPDHKIHFVKDTFSFFQVPAGGVDPHGYLKHFWHVSVLDAWEEEIRVIMYPNKRGNLRYPYQEVKRFDEASD